MKRGSGHSVLLIQNLLGVQALGRKLRKEWVIAEGVEHACQMGDSQNGTITASSERCFWYSCCKKAKGVLARCVDDEVNSGGFGDAS